MHTQPAQPAQHRSDPMTIDCQEYQKGLVAHVSYVNGERGPAVITARHWTDGGFEILIRPLNSDECIVLDRVDIAAINDLLRTQEALPAPTEAARVEMFTPYGMKQPQRPAAAAVGAQGSKYMTLVEMTAAIEDWSKSFETQREALDGLRIDWGNGGGSYLEDWEDVAPAEWQAHDLLAAIRLVREGLERAQAAAMPPAAKPLVPWEMMVLIENINARLVALGGHDDA